MQLRGLRPGAITYDAALSACETGHKQGHHALHKSQNWPILGLRPDVISYSAAISACEKGQPHNRAASVPGEVAQGPRPNVDTYSAAISAREKGQTPQEAWDLVPARQFRGLRPDVIQRKTGTYILSGLTR